MTAIYVVLGYAAAGVVMASIGLTLVPPRKGEPFSVLLIAGLVILLVWPFFVLWWAGALIGRHIGR